MKYLELIQEQWFYYAIFFFVSFLIGSIKLFSKFGYNAALFVVLLLLEILICNWLNINLLYPVILSAGFFLFFTLRENRAVEKKGNKGKK